MADVAAKPLLGHYKDEVLDDLARRGNIAQFVSFAPGPDPTLRYAHIRGAEIGDEAPLHEAAEALLKASAEGSINLRSFHPHQPKSHEFIYGITSGTRSADEVRRLSAKGLYTILNETVDVLDGGVSGVAYGGLIEFAPEDTPRCVEKPGVASLPRALGMRILRTVYGFLPSLDYGDAVRVEFSIHPLRRGLRAEHTIIWEEEEIDGLALAPGSLTWPNRFSRFIGDKAFGLLVADAIGLRVPFTRVVSRRIAPYEFGVRTNTDEYWVRTAPFEPIPGHFTTRRGWIDPFELLEREDPEGELVPAVLSQEGVPAAHSGAAFVGPDGAIVEGVAGEGEAFMQGDQPPRDLPIRVIRDVKAALNAASQHLGPVRVEWVHDGDELWIVQLHRGSAPSTGLMIYPGTPKTEHAFDIANGLEALRGLVDAIAGTGDGIVLNGAVGLTSHFGDVLRRGRVPSRIEVPTQPAVPKLFNRTT
jgi:hypothetical protein